MIMSRSGPAIPGEPATTGNSRYRERTMTSRSPFDARRTITAPLLAVLLASLLPMPARATPTPDAERWIPRLDSEDAFEARRAETELRRLADEALLPLAEHWRTSAGRERLLVESLLDELVGRFLEHLESEFRSLQLDQAELLELTRLQQDLEDLERLREEQKKWRADIPEFQEKAVTWLTWKNQDDRRRLVKSGAAAPEDADGAWKERDEKLWERLSAQVAEIREQNPDFEATMPSWARLRRLESMSSRLADSYGEVAVLRRDDLEQRIAEREPRVDELIAQLQQIGLPAFSGLAARREWLILEGTPADDKLRSVVAVLFDELLASKLDQLLEKDASAVFPEGEPFELERHHLAAFWEIEIERRGKRQDDAETWLKRHLDATLDDLSASLPKARKRAAIELWRRGDRGRVALESTLPPEENEDKDTRRTATGSPRPGSDHSFLASLLEWRIHPEVYGRVGIHFRDYRQLSYAARKRKIFQYARAADIACVPTLRAILFRDDLESSMQLKYAAARALLTQVRDRTGFLYLQSRYPELQMVRPEFSRDLLLLQGLAYVQSKDYANAVTEFQKILAEFPFDFEGNYHLAFAYLLLKDYKKAVHYFEIAARINSKDQLTLYNLACAYSLDKNLPKALEVLDRSVDAGFDDADHLEKDRDLDPIRGEPKYREILEKCRAKG